MRRVSVVIAGFSALWAGVSGCLENGIAEVPESAEPAAPQPRAALRDGVWVIDGDMLARPGIVPRWGVVHYGRPWPGAKVPYRFSSDPQYVGDVNSRARVREAIDVVRRRTELDWIRLGPGPAPPGGHVEIRFWDKSWGSAQVGYVGETQYINLPAEPSVRLVLHEMGHVMGLGHEHQHPARDQFVEVNRGCVPEEHRDSFAPRVSHVVSRGYDMDSVMHYRSSGFCSPDLADADGDGNTHECAFVLDNAKLGKCYALRRIWGSCDREICIDRDGDGFREYIRGGDTLSDGDVRTIHTLHREMLQPRWPSRSFGRAMVAGDTDGDGQAEVYVAAMGDGDCGALWELRPNADGTALVRHRTTRARWSCEAEESAPVRMVIAPARRPGQSELWVGISGPSRRDRGGWVEQWQRMPQGEMQIVRRWTPQDWEMPPAQDFGQSIAVLDRDGDGLAEDLAIAAPSERAIGRVYYAHQLSRDERNRAGRWGHVAGGPGTARALAWLHDARGPELVLATGCGPLAGQPCVPSLWSFARHRALTQATRSDSLGLHLASHGGAMTLMATGDRRGLWWSLPGAQSEPAVSGGSRGGVWAFAGAEGRLVPGAEPLLVGVEEPAHMNLQGAVPVQGPGGDAVILPTQDGRAWLGRWDRSVARYEEIPRPSGCPLGVHRDFAGWWDAEGVHIVSAWTDAAGERQLHLSSMKIP